MKLFLSALLLAAATAVFAQNPSPSPTEAAQPTLGPAHYVGDLSAHKVEPQRSCPVFVTAASADAPAQYLPTAPPDSLHKSMLTLHLQYQSRLEVESVRMTVHVRMKNNKYDLDTTDLEIPVTIHATAGFDSAGEHALQFPLPRNVYFFGVAQASVDSVSFTSGEVWRPQGRQTCGWNGQGSEQIGAK